MHTNLKSGRSGGASPTTEENVYADVYRVLLIGMAISTTLFVIGVVSALIHPRWIPITPDWVRQHYHLAVVAAGLKSLDPMVLMMIATALLILTPVVRVVVSIYAFAVDSDRKFVAVTSAVLAVMALTVILGLLGLK